MILIDFGFQNREVVACKQLELQVALARLDGVGEDELRRLIGARLALHDDLTRSAACDVDIAVGDCIRQTCATHSIWEALESGVRTGAVMIDIDRDGFIEGYRDALGESPLPLAAE